MLPCFYIPAGNSSASDNIDDSDDEALFAKPFLTQTEGEHKGIIYKDILFLCVSNDIVCNYFILTCSYWYFGNW